MQVQQDKQMRREENATSGWETIDPSSDYEDINTSREGEFVNNRFAFTRVDITEINLPDAMHFFVGTEGGTNILDDGLGIIYDFNTYQNVSDALANVPKYADFYGVLKLIGHNPNSLVVTTAVAQAQAMVDAALAETN